MALNDILKHLGDAYARITNHVPAIKNESAIFYHEFETKRVRDFDVLLNILQSVNEHKEADLERFFESNNNARILTKMDLIADSIDRIATRVKVDKGAYIQAESDRLGEDYKVFLTEIEAKRIQVDEEFDGKLQDYSNHFEKMERKFNLENSQPPS